MKYLTARNYLGLKLLLSVIGVAIIAALPLIGLSGSWQQIFLTFFAYLALSQMWNILAGYTGLISLGQPAFIGLGAYTLSFTMHGHFGYPLWVGILLAGVVAALFALLISPPLFRLGGLYFAIGTLMVPEVLRFWFTSWVPWFDSTVGGGQGMLIRARIPFEEIYWILLAMVVISTAVSVFIIKSRVGLGIQAIRDDESTSASSGINVFSLKLFVFVLCAFVTGMAGASYYIFVGYVEPAQVFNVQWTMYLLIPTIYGGIGTLIGPFVGTAIFITTYFLLSGDPGVDLFIKAILLVVVLFFAPRGVVGTFIYSKYYPGFARAVSNLTSKYLPGSKEDV